VDTIGAGQESVSVRVNIVVKIRCAADRRKCVEYRGGCQVSEI
jgi:hypothetical protein